MSNFFKPFLKRIGIGIDFGTFKSAIAVIDKHKPHIIEIRPPWAQRHNEKRMLPTLAGVEITDKNKLGIFLDDSASLYEPEVKDNYFQITNFKLDVGREHPKQIPNELKYKLKGKNAIFIHGLVGKVFSRLRDKAIMFYEKKNNLIKITERLRKWVISVPIGWNYKQRRATLFAARISALEDVILVEEPVAAAFYLLHQGKFHLYNGSVLVIDYGAGTCDVALFTIDNQKIRVLSSISNSWQRGGKDIDELLFEYIVDKYSKKVPNKENHVKYSIKNACLYRGKEKMSNLEYQEALTRIRKLKLDLNNELKKTNDVYMMPNDDYDFKEKNMVVIPGTSISVYFDILEFKNLIKKEIDEFGKFFLKILIQQKGFVEKLNQVLLIGGSSNIFCFKEVVQSVIKSILTESNLRIENIDIPSIEEPEWCVVRGAALFSETMKQKNIPFSMILSKSISFKLQDSDNVEFKEPNTQIHYIATPLPISGYFWFKVNEKELEKICIEIYQDDIIIDIITISSGQTKIPAFSEIWVEYEIGIDQIIRFLYIKCNTIKLVIDNVNHSTYHCESETSDVIRSREICGVI